MGERRSYADDFRVAFRVDQAGIAVTIGATNTLTERRPRFIEHDCGWCVKGLHPRLAQPLINLLYARLVAYGRMRIGSGGRGLGRIRATLTMNLVKPFRLAVVRFKLFVTDRPGGRDAAMMLDLT